MEWRGREWSGVEWREGEGKAGQGRAGQGRAGQGRVPDCLGGLSRVGISSRSTRPWNGQPPSTVYAENASYTYLLGLRFSGLDNLPHTYLSIAGSMALAEW